MSYTQISQIASIHGDSFQRVAAQFAYALSIRLVKRWSGLYKVIEPNKWPKTELGILNKPSFPLLGLAYTVIVQTLVQSLTYDNMIHLVDLGSGDPKLWVSFMRSLASMSRGGSLHLKITCIHRNKVVLDILGKKLVKEAQSLLHLPFEYNPLNVGLGELNIMEMIEVRSGEALAFVSILSLHVLLAEDDRVEAHFGFGSHDKIDNVKDCKEMGKFLATIRSNMSPKLILLVEQEAEHNLNRLVDRFIGSLHYYSAVFDSLDFCFGNSSSSSKERLTLEAIFGKEIENIVACEGLEREETHEKYEKWVVRFRRVGFRPVRLWSNAMEDANKMVEAFDRKGLKVINDKASLIICWHERPLYAVSAWTC